MESYIVDWLNLLFRWLHLITGAAWIGTSFYFNWLNHNLRPPMDQHRKDEGIAGELFAVHGGHFYQVSKYAGAPATLPKTLHWFKWEAYFTWITGVCLLFIVYYWNPSTYLRPLTAGENWNPWSAIGLGIGALVVSWIIYDLLCKSPLIKKPVIMTILGFVMFTGLAYFLTQKLGSRAAYIHMGATLGTIMAANVFFVIIPNQKIMVNTMMAGEQPDTSLGDQGSLRSLHNNYFTLPVLFIMISNHFSMTYGHSANWAILMALSLIGAGARHYFNLKHKGQHKVWILPVAAVAMMALAFVARPQASIPIHTDTAQQKVLLYQDIHPIIVKRCQPCHVSKPNYMGFTAPPQGIVYETPQQVKNLAGKIKAQVIDVHIMPPGNLTKITDEERALLGQWIETGARLK